MAKRSRLQDGIRTLLFMLVVTVVFISATSATHLATTERVERNNRLYVQRAILQAGGVAVPPDAAKAAATYDRLVAELRGADGTAYYRVSPEAGASVVMLRQGAGLWGKIGAAVGFTEALDGTMTGIAFTSQNETPGLGARIEEAWFRSQFAGKSGPFTVKKKGEADAGDKFDGITGATITTDAVCNMINDAIKDAPGVVGTRGTK